MYDMVYDIIYDIKYDMIFNFLVCCPLMSRQLFLLRKLVFSMTLLLFDKLQGYLFTSCTAHWCLDKCPSRDNCAPYYMQG